MTVTVREHLDYLARRIISAADDGLMPQELKDHLGAALDNVRREIEIFGHVNSGLPDKLLDMPWDEFVYYIDKHRTKKMH